MSIRGRDTERHPSTIREYLDRYPEDDYVTGEPVDDFMTVTGGAGEPEHLAPVGTWTPGRSHVCMSSPSDESRPASQLPDVSEPGDISAGLQ